MSKFFFCVVIIAAKNLAVTNAYAPISGHVVSCVA